MTEESKMILSYFLIESFSLAALQGICCTTPQPSYAISCFDCRFALLSYLVSAAPNELLPEQPPLP